VEQTAQRAKSTVLVRVASVVAAALLFTAAFGCNTLEGAGEDVEAAGEAVQDAAE